MTTDFSGSVAMVVQQDGAGNRHVLSVHMSEAQARRWIRETRIGSGPEDRLVETWGVHDRPLPTADEVLAAVDEAWLGSADPQGAHLLEFAREWLRDIEADEPGSDLWECAAAVADELAAYAASFVEAVAEARP